MYRLLPLLLLVACQAPESPPAAPEAPPKAEQPAGPATAAPLAAAEPALAPPPAPPKRPQGALAVDLVPQYGKLLAGGEQAIHLLVRLEGQGDAPAARPPLDLAVVLDRSGSMQGDKIRAVKQAALELLDKLGPDDRVTLISYSSDVRTHTTRLPVDAAGKKTLREALLALQADGMTALGPATVQALEVLEQAQGETRMAHVLLLSDGLANVGERTPAALGARAAAGFNRGVSLSTLGVGLDYNEDLMTKLADQGGGRYHFIRDEAAVSAVLDDELKGLVATVARGIELELATTGGAELLKAFGYPTTTDDGVTRVRIGAVGAGQKREVVLRLRAPAVAPPHLDLGKLAVHFTDIAADGQIRRVDVPLRLEVTAEAAEHEASEHKDVTVRVAEVESAEQLEMAASAAERGDFDAAGSTLQIAIDDLKQKVQRAPSPKLQKQLESLEEARREVGQARHSDEGRKGYSKKYKARAYSNKKK